MTNSPVDNESAPLNVIFENWKRGDDSREAIIFALWETAAKGQIDIIGEPCEIRWRDRLGHREMTDFVLSCDDRRNDRDRTLVRLLGGVVAGVTEDNSFWVVAARPSELQKAEPGTKDRYWRFDLEHTIYLGDGAAPLDMKGREQRVVDDFVAQPLTRTERYEREIESNMFWYGNAFGPSCDERQPIFGRRIH